MRYDDIYVGENDTWLSEGDILAWIQQLDRQGLSFHPLTRDEIVLSERLCRRGVLGRDGHRVHLIASP